MKLANVNDVSGNLEAGFAAMLVIDETGSSAIGDLKAQLR